MFQTDDQKDTLFQFLQNAHFSQVVMDGAASDEVESLQELCETLTQGQSFCQATDRLQESDEAQETQSSDAVLTSDW